MTGRLDGLVVAVTGSTGIGAACARRIAAEGASVFVASLDEEELGTLQREITGAGGVCATAEVDLTEETSTVEVFANCVERFGHLDGAVAVAGASGRKAGDGPLHDLSLPAWEETFRLNATPMFLTVREAVKAIRPTGGSVVVISSVLASHPSPNYFATHAYAAAKASAHGLVRSTAAFYAPDGIRVNLVAPGLVDTPMSARAAADDDIVAYVKSKQPLASGLLPPDSIADAVIFFLSNESRHITGQVLEVDGGWSLS